MPMACIRRTAVTASLATCLALAVHAEDTAPSPPAAKTPPPSAEKPAEPAKIRELPLVFRTQPTECHHFRPTGSHIAAVRCDAKSADDSPRARAARELAKSDLEEMRRRQMAQELLRQQALSNAVNRGR
jgi:hypothetical protein